MESSQGKFIKLMHVDERTDKFFRLLSRPIIMQKIDIDCFFKKLQNHAKELKSKIYDARDFRKPVALDQQNIGRLTRADALQVQAMAVEVERRRYFELEQINRALKRIALDEYGQCLSCGEDIDLARLDIIPTTMTCIQCAEV